MQKTENNNAYYSFKLSKKSVKVLCIIAAIIVGIGCIPFEKEISLLDHENTKSYDYAYNYQSKAYLTNTRCLDDAIDESNGNRDEYYRLADKCEPISTDKTMEILKFNNGPCNSRYDYSISMTVDDCQTFYVKDKKLYTNLSIKPSGKNEYREEYDDVVDIKVTSGSSADVKSYYTVTCRAFGLICGNGEWLDENTHFHLRLIIGKNFKIDRYAGVCDSESGKEMLDKDLCIYKDSTPKYITIEDLLK